MVYLLLELIFLFVVLQQDWVLQLLLMLILIKVPININSEVEMEFILDFNHSPLLIVVSSLYEEEQVVWLFSYPHVFA